MRKKHQEQQAKAQNNLIQQCVPQPCRGPNPGVGSKQPALRSQIVAEPAKPPNRLRMSPRIVRFRRRNKQAVDVFEALNLLRGTVAIGPSSNPCRKPLMYVASTRNTRKIIKKAQKIKLARPLKPAQVA